MRNIILFIFIFFIMNACSNNYPISQIVYTYPDSSIWKREYYKNSLMINKEGKFKDTIKVGIFRLYQKSGMISFENNYINGKLNGIHRIYYEIYLDENFVKEEGVYLNGIPIGVWKFFYPDGNLKKVLKIDSTGLINYCAYFNEEGIFLKDTMGILKCEDCGFFK